MKMTECIEGHIHGESSKIDISKGISDQFDIFFFSVGWESRCTQISNYIKSNTKISQACTISFRINEKAGYKQLYKKNIHKCLTDKGIPIIDIPINIHLSSHTEEIENLTKPIFNIIKSQAEKVKRPLKVGFEISSCPRRILLQVLINGIKSESIKQLSFFYCEGEYKKDNTRYKSDIGDWEIFEVTELLNDYSLCNETVFVISAGFEEERYRREIEKYEPYNLGILIPYPGFKDEYSKKSKEICQNIKRDFHIRKGNILTAHAGDAIQAWNELKEADINKGNYNIVFLPFGPKPHVIAMGLHAFLNKNVHLMYRIPKHGYKQIEVRGSDVMWKYEINNLSHL